FRAALDAALKALNGHNRQAKDETGATKRSAKETSTARETGYGAKTDFVLKSVEKHPKKGITPAEIKAMSPPEWTATTSYPYSQLWKLKDGDFIRFDKE